jgi:bile acid:Na+ symporter, BASS family
MLRDMSVEPTVPSPGAGINRLVTFISRVVQRNLIWLLISSYAIATVAPSLGLWIRDTAFGEITVFHDTSRVSLLMIMLAFLLFNAGLGLHADQLHSLLRSKAVLVVGLIANILIPIAYIVITMQVLRSWHNPAETQNILIGLALVASMPIAGSSTAWAQNAEGNLALSLGLVLFSTLLSPLITPAALHLFGTLASGEYATALHNVAAYSTGTFLGLWVVLPAMLGLVVRRVVGEVMLTSLRPALILLNASILLLLNYSNASVSLPQVVGNPDADFLIVILAMTLTLCVITFSAAYGLARLLNADQHQTTSLMYGLGMNNNGTGLVLAALELPMYPLVMLPIIFYNLIQHLVAGTVHAFLYRRKNEARR